MKLRNKKTGEIRELPDGFFCGDNLKKICEEWEDYEEPKGYWWISPLCTDIVHAIEDCKDEIDQYNNEIGNYFETREEAVKAAEKLKSWKRLKDRGVKIIDYDCYGGTNTKGYFSGKVKVTIDVPQDVDKYLFELLFGGKE